MINFSTKFAEQNFLQGKLDEELKIASLSKIVYTPHSDPRFRVARQDAERLIRNCSTISKREIESRTSDIRRYLFDTSAARPDQFLLAVRVK